MKTLHLKCKLCHEVHDYQFDNNKIIAIEAAWKNPKQSTILLANPPKESEIYELYLSSPIRINLDDLFWVVYQNPFAHYNGYEKAADIKDVRFCLCKAIEVKNFTEHKATLFIKVIQCLDLDHQRAIEHPSPEQLVFLQSKINSRYCETLNFKNYILLEINIEGDLGMSIFLQKKENTHRIVAINEWSFHRNVWYLLWSEDLLKSRKK